MLINTRIRNSPQINFHRRNKALFAIGFYLPVESNWVVTAVERVQLSVRSFEKDQENGGKIFSFSLFDGDKSL